MNMPLSNSDRRAMDAIAEDVAKVPTPQIDGGARNAATINGSATKAETARAFLRGAVGDEPTEGEVLAFTLGRNEGTKKADRYAEYVRKHFPDSESEPAPIPAFAANRSDSYPTSGYVEREDPEKFDEFTGPCEETPAGYETLPDTNGSGGIIAWAIMAWLALVLCVILWKFSSGGGR